MLQYWEEIRMGDTKIIFIGNYKGGVGKTTSVLNFAEYFTNKGKNILVIDLDPQSSLSEILVSNNKGSLKDLEPDKTLNYVFDLNIKKIKKYCNIDLKFDSIIQNYQNKGYDFIASSLFYQDGRGLDEIVLEMEDNIEYLSILKIFLDEATKTKEYDFILIDCPPSNNLITKSAFLLSDYYIVPSILDGISANGVAHYIRTVKSTYKKYCMEEEDAILFRHFFGNEPKLLGVFFTFIRGQVTYDSAYEQMKQTVSGLLKEDIYFFKEEVNNYIDIARSSILGEASKARNDYNQLSDSVLKRINDLK